MRNFLKYTKLERVFSIIVMVAVVVCVVAWFFTDDLFWFVGATLMLGSLTDLRVARLERYVEELTNRRP